MMIEATMDSICASLSWRVTPAALAMRSQAARRPAESSASTSGTPAANIVDSVRVQRATADLYMRSPNTGIFSNRRSMRFCMLSERFQLWMKK